MVMIDHDLLKQPIQSKTAQVIETLTELILTGDLGNNSMLPPEQEMCRRLGVSRSIFREAMKILAAKGLAEIRQGLGTVVKAPGENVPAEALSNFIHLNQISLFQVIEIRAPLDVEIARLAARRRTKKHIEVLKSTLEAMQSRENDRHAFVQADHDFHRVLATATENPLFVIMFLSLEKFVRYMREVTIQFGTDKVIRGHRAIFEAVRDGNAAAAAEAMSAHMESTIRDVRRLDKDKGGFLSEKFRKSLRKK
jgi:GntR family transcriptional repressor for pyruvate dehydrogenase complex